MKGRIEEAEVLIRLDQKDKTAYICVSAWPAMARKMSKLYGPSIDTVDGRRWKLPLKAVSFRKLQSETRPKRAFLGFKRRENRQSDGSRDAK